MSQSAIIRIINTYKLLSLRTVQDHLIVDYSQWQACYTKSIWSSLLLLKSFGESLFLVLRHWDSIEWQKSERGIKYSNLGQVGAKRKRKKKERKKPMKINSTLPQRKCPSFALNYECPEKENIFLPKKFFLAQKEREWGKCVSACLWVCVCKCVLVEMNVWPGKGNVKR